MFTAGRAFQADVISMHREKNGNVHIVLLLVIGRRIGRVAVVIPSERVDQIPSAGGESA